MKKKMLLYEVITLNILRFMTHFKDLRKNISQDIRKYIPYLNASNKSFQFIMKFLLVISIYYKKLLIMIRIYGYLKYVKI